jgi:hypothetical protein
MSNGFGREEDTELARRLRPAETPFHSGELEDPIHDGVVAAHERNRDVTVPPGAIRSDQFSEAARIEEPKTSEVHECPAHTFLPRVGEHRPMWMNRSS